VAYPPGLTELPPDHEASLVLVRHGESRFVVEGRFQGRLDPPLSGLGERQATYVAERLRDPTHAPALPLPGGRPVAVWHSPLARAAATADAIAARQPDGVPLRRVAELTEIGQGEWEGRLMSEVEERWPDLLAAWRADPTRANAPSGEPLAEAAVRVRSALATILVALAPSEAAVPAAVSPVLGYPAARSGPAGEPPAPPSHPWAIVVAHDGVLRLALLSLLGLSHDRFWSFPFALCAVSVVALRGRLATLRAHNLADHLAPLAADERAAAESRGERRGAL
jgi:broad specificity phosphatase PhoE